MPAGFYRGKHFPLYQVAWPPNGLYPWSSQASESYEEWQPVPGELPKCV